MKLSYQYRLYPTSAQRTALSKALDACRWAYNQVLETRRNAWRDEEKPLSCYDTISLVFHWKKVHPFLKDAYSQSLQEVCMRVDLAFKAFFRRVKAGEKPGFPRFQGYERYNSFTYTQNGFRLLENGRLKLGKVGDVKIRLHRPIEGKIKRLTIRRDGLGNWYASFSVIVEPKILPHRVEIAGVDLGLKTFATLSNGESIKRERWLKTDERDLKRLQRRVSRLPKGSQERRKARRALQHRNIRISNRRKNFAHQQSRKLINRYQFLAFEKLEIRDMQSNGRKPINRSIGDVAWYQFVQFCAYKAEYAGRIMVLVDPKNTTQMCSGCSEIVPKDLSVRIHDCPHCGLRLDRDHNAAINILGRGLATLCRQRQ